jgi:creatinine amidohydrolase
VIAPLVLALDAMVMNEVDGFDTAFAGIPDPAEREEMRRDLAADFHAGFFETSVALAVASGHVSPDHVRLPPCPPTHPPRALLTLARLFEAAGKHRFAGELRVMAGGLAWMALRPFPGYTSRPHHATSAAGEVFVTEMLDRIEELAKKVFLGGAASPRPPFTWMRALTLGGRTPMPKVPIEDVI